MYANVAVIQLIHLAGPHTTFHPKIKSETKVQEK